MGAAENKALVRNMFSELSKGNAQGWLGALADDARVIITGTTVVSGTHSKAEYVNKAYNVAMPQIEGTVVLKAVVSEGGKVEGVRLVEGNPTLAAAAISAVKQWHYRPYVRDGKARPFQTIVLVEFQRR